MINNALFEFYKGDTYSRDFSITGWNRDITEIYFTVKESVDNKKYVLQKWLNNGITLMDNIDGTLTYNLHINSSDTDNLKNDTDYVFDIEIQSKINDEVFKQTIIVGTFRLTADVTRSYNEREV